MADKYPNVTPYLYCGGNPVMLVDPDGRMLNISGCLSKEALNQLQCYVGESVRLTINEEGNVSYQTTKHLMSLRARRICGIIDNKVIQTNIETIDGTSTPDVGYFIGGAFLGNEVTLNSDGKVKEVKAFQLINPIILERADTYSRKGTCMAHETTEAYEGARISKRSKISSPRSNQDGTVYGKAHKRASSQPKIYETWFDKDGVETNVIDDANRIRYHVSHKKEKKVIYGIDKTE